MKSLEVVFDPELGVDIVNLGLIYGMDISDTGIRVRMTMTSPMCPYAPQIIQETKETLLANGFDDVAIDLTFDPPWSPEKITEKAKDMLGIF